MGSRMVLPVLQILFFLKLLGSGVLGDEILGCGGFVKSKVPIDFSKVEVRLLTPEGIQKYQTECAPNNGYYMVPFVEKGDFILKVKPPPGWTFDPMSVSLHVDGLNDPCSQGKDINFEFLGFTIVGQVKSVGVKSGGPESVKLSLKADDTSKVIATTTSAEGGSFQFSSIFPGKYKIQASHDSFTFQQSEIPVTVAQTNVQCSSAIIVSGYDVHGKVSAAQLPAKDVHMLLFSENQIPGKVKGCTTAPPVGAEEIIKSQKLVFICSATSGAQGGFIFPSLPPQDYVLVPFHKGEHIEFDVEPQELKFTVHSGSVVLQKNFAVTGFSVTGHVLDSVKGSPVPGAKVFVNGKEQAVTNDKGLYRLQHMNSGMYKITLEKKDIFFPESSLRVGSDTPRLPDIIANKFSLCGKIEITIRPTKPFKIQQLSVSISGIDGSDEQVEKLDANAEYCFKMSPGGYALAPIIPESITNSGVELDPPVHKVTVQNSPVNGIKFTQVLADIKVSVQCIDGCHGVQVEAVMDGESQKSTRDVMSTNKKNTADLIFSDILPGTYHVKVFHEHWCWEANRTTIEATGKNEENLVVFKQSGFKLTCSISHNVAMAIHHNKVAIKTFQLKKGRNQLCLMKPGEYELEPKSCHLFEQQKVVYNTADPQPVVMQAFAHQTTLRIRSMDHDPNLRIIMKSKTKGKEFKMVPTEEEQKYSRVHEYTTQYQARDKERLHITPTSDILLFEPPSVIIIVIAENCGSDLIVFKAFKGLFIKGSVTPKLEGVSITVTASDEDKTETRLKTDQDGKYRVGPLNPTITYTITASKDGYVLIQNEKKQENFVARKLSKITFHVKMENEDQPLPGVLITISGGSYRSNNLTDAEGNLALTKLEPAQYYFKAVMKEYEFQPSSQVIDLKEGDELKIEIEGKRVAFSCFGTVASLNGQPESDVTVQAFSVTEGNDHAEETTTNEQGEFRIKGLLPDTKYRVELKKSGTFERVSPSEKQIMVGNNDVKNIRFIAFRSLSQFELTGNVVTNNEYLRYLKIALYRASDLSEPVHSASLTASPFFHLPPLPRDNQEYHIKLETTLDKYRYSYTEPAAGFFATGTYKHITFQFHPQMKTLEADTPQASYVTLPVALLIILLAYNHVKVLAWLQMATDKAYSVYLNRRNEPVDAAPTKPIKASKARKDK